MNIIILHNQSLLDVCLQHTGSLAGIFELALANGLSVSDDVIAGQTLQVPDTLAVDKDVLAYYRAKNIQPATAFTSADKKNSEKPEGISIWAINLDFKVS